MRTLFLGKSVLVTGSSSGIGRALAIEFARQGADVALCARRLDLLQAVARDIEGLGRRALPVACDVTRPDDVSAAVAATVGAFGGLDVAVANAGFGVMGRVDELALDDFRRQLDTNVYGVLHTVKAALPELVKRSGCVAIMGSVSGHISLPGAAPYSMSKSAVRALADALYYEMRARGVGVTLISPGFVASEIRRTDNQGQHHADARDPIPAWLVMPTEKAARQMVRAIARRKREAVITKHGRIAVWLHRHFPWLVRLAVGIGIKGRPDPSRADSR